MTNRRTTENSLREAQSVQTHEAEIEPPAPTVTYFYPPEANPPREEGKRNEATRDELIELMIETEQEQSDTRLERIDGCRDAFEARTRKNMV